MPPGPRGERAASAGTAAGRVRRPAQPARPVDMKAEDLRESAAILRSRRGPCVVPADEMLPAAVHLQLPPSMLGAKRRREIGARLR